MSLIIPDELVQASGLSEDELLRELVLLLFQRENISLDKASCILGLTGNAPDLWIRFLNRR